MVNRKKHKKWRRLKRRMAVYVLRGGILLVLAVMTVLIICGCLYLCEHLGRRQVTAAYSDKGDAPVPFQKNTDTISGGQAADGFCVVLDAGHG